MTITEWIKYEKLEKENQVLKNQLAEKDKEISKLKQDMADLECNQYTLESNQLFKEDFKISEFCIDCRAGLFYTEYYQKIKKGRKINLSTKKCSYCGSDRIIKLKDNSLYDKLPSKDVK